MPEAVPHDTLLVSDAVKRAMTLLPPRLVLAVALLLTAACRHSAEAPSAFPVADRTADCLPDLPLTDADGRPFSLASLKGKPVLFDFIYTTCPGPCAALTTHVVAVAKQLGRALGDAAGIVSVTVDPEHDRPADLLRFARAQGAEIDGWTFLTGAPKDIDDLMGRFHVKRDRNAEGPLQHVLEIFLVGPDGHPLRQYVAARADPATIAADVRRAARGERLD